jgi:hypothetical protein
MFHQSSTNTLIVLIIMNNCHYQNLVFFNNIKKIKNSKCCKPKIIMFKNNNKHQNIEIWSRKLLLYSTF